MPPEAVPSRAANIMKACKEHCATNDNKCISKCKCAFACYMVNKAKASMKLASGGFGLPA
jgi:hypothetical protein